MCTEGAGIHSDHNLQVTPVPNPGRPSEQRRVKSPQSPRSGSEAGDWGGTVTDRAAHVTTTKQRGRTGEHQSRERLEHQWGRRHPAGWLECSSREPGRDGSKASRAELWKAEPHRISRSAGERWSHQPEEDTGAYFQHPLVIGNTICSEIKEHSASSY